MSSLRAKLIFLFAAILTATTLISAFVTSYYAERTVEAEIRERAFETGRALADELRQSSTFDLRETTERMKGLLRSHGDIRAVELAIDQAGASRILRATMTQNGPQIETSEGDAEVVRKPEAKLMEDPDGRFWSASVPAKLGHSRARLTLEASLKDADRLVALESRISWGVLLAGGLVLIIAAQLLVSRLIGRPAAAMSLAMAAVESGRLDVTVPLGAGDEFDQLAHGFNTMLERIRGFNQELTDKIEQATADLAKKNHDLAELNDLLVAARRDLTAKERLAALGQLAGTIAHELGNPLNSISGHVQLLERRDDLTGSMRDDLRLVGSEVQRMTDVIRRFLDSTRGLRPAPEPVNLAALIPEALDMSLSAEARARLRVTRDIAPDLSAVVTDPSLVRHVLTNLIANAVDAMPQGGELSVGAWTEGAELCLAVRDSGSGISSEERRRIFEPFFTTKPKGKGTGLGLAICREIALALKGRIDVRSQPGQGSTFTLRIPYLKAQTHSPAVALAAKAV